MFQSQYGKILLFSTLTRPAGGATQPPIQCILATISLEAKRLGHKLTTQLHPVPRLRMVEPYLNFLVFMV